MKKYRCKVCGEIITEGMQTMRTLGNNMAWLLKCIEQGKKMGIEEPKNEEKIKTNYIR